MSTAPLKSYLNPEVEARWRGRETVPARLVEGVRMESLVAALEARLGGLRVARSAVLQVEWSHLVRGVRVLTYAVGTRDGCTPPRGSAVPARVRRALAGVGAAGPAEAERWDGREVEALAAPAHPPA